MTDSERIALLESAVRELAGSVSTQAGELKAVMVALHATLMGLGDNRDVADRVRYWLEKVHEIDVGSAENQRFLDAFEAQRNVIHHALSVKAEAAKQHHLPEQARP